MRAILTMFAVVCFLLYDVLAEESLAVLDVCVYCAGATGHSRYQAMTSYTQLSRLQCEYYE